MAHSPARDWVVQDNLSAHVGTRVHPLVDYDVSLNELSGGTLLSLHPIVRTCRSAGFNAHKWAIAVVKLF